MKPLYFFILLFFASLDTESQINNINVLLLKTDSAVRAYFNNLNAERPNQYFKIDQKVTPEGDLMLSCMFWPGDEEYFKCMAITAVFERINGKEICIMQTILGSEEHANFHLTYIKDNFKYVSAGVWEKVVGDGKLKFLATFRRISGDITTFEIKYEIRNA